MIKNILRSIFIMSLSIGMNAMAIEIQSNGICQIDGVDYPAIGFGTYPLQGEVCEKAVKDAAKVGYRIIDTATFYDNFEPIARALKGLGRQNFYIISKVWPDSQTPEKLRQDIKATLRRLQTDYLDAYLIHWPNSEIPIEGTLTAMEELRRKGVIRHIGLSNVNANHVKRALEVKVPISWVQVEMNTNFYDPELLTFCQEKGIAVQAWAPLGRGSISNDGNLAALGKKYGKTASQIALRWIVQHHCLPLPGSQNPVHIRQNFEIFDFALSLEEMNQLDRRARIGSRVRISDKNSMGFTDEFDYSYEQCWPKR